MSRTKIAPTSISARSIRSPGGCGSCRSPLALQFSAGQLTDAEVDHHGTTIDATRATASATYHTAVRGDGLWATTIAWGRNVEPSQGSNALLAESNLTLHDRDSWFGRFEVVGKTPHDLAIVESFETVAVAKLQGGYTRSLTTWRGLKPGVGGSLSVGFVPETFKAAYGRRANVGFGVFLTLRPAAMAMHGGHEGAGAHQHSAAPDAIAEGRHLGCARRGESARLVLVHGAAHLAGRAGGEHHLDGAAIRDRAGRGVELRQLAGHVDGGAARRSGRRSLLTKRPRLTPAQVRDRLRLSADRVTWQSGRPDEEYGFGRLNVEKLLR